MDKFIAMEGSIIDGESAGREAPSIHEALLLKTKITGGNLTVCTFCCVLIILFALSGCSKGPPAAGEVLPGFTLSDLKGEKITAPDDFIGKVMIIRFWVEGCKSCLKEMPMIDDLYNKYKEGGLVVLAVNVGQSKDVAEAFVTKLKISYPVLLDTHSVTAKRYGIKAVPFTLIVDRKGIIRKRILGETESETFEKIIKNLL
jgi:peroxiredoxin